MIVEILDSDDNPVPYEDVDDDTGSMLRRTIRLPAGTNIKVSLLFPFSIDLHGAGGCIVTIGLGQSLDEPSRVQSVWYDAADLKGLESTRSYFLVWADESHDGETQTIQRYFTAPDAVPGKTTLPSGQSIQTRTVWLSSTVQMDPNIHRFGSRVLTIFRQ